VSGRAEGEIVDFNVVIDSPEPTRLYIDRHIIEAAARDLFGMVKEGKAIQLEAWHQYEKERADELEEQCKHLQETVKTLRRLDAQQGKELADNAG
jgi:valyl-tRNA synthetase